MRCCEGGSLECAKLLVEEAHADVAACNVDGQTALHVAFVFSHSGIAEYLLQKDCPRCKGECSRCKLNLKLLARKRGKGGGGGGGAKSGGGSGGGGGGGSSGGGAKSNGGGGKAAGDAGGAAASGGFGQGSAVAAAPVAKQQAMDNFEEEFGDFASMLSGLKEEMGDEGAFGGGENNGDLGAMLEPNPTSPNQPGSAKKKKKKKKKKK